jgi:hypothetical protein
VDASEREPVSRRERRRQRRAQRGSQRDKWRGTRARGGSRLCSGSHPLPREDASKGIRGSRAQRGGKRRTGGAVHPGRAHTRRRRRSRQQAGERSLSTQQPRHSRGAVQGAIHRWYQPGKSHTVEKGLREQPVSLETTTMWSLRPNIRCKSVDHGRKETGAPSHGTAHPTDYV